MFKKYDGVKCIWHKNINMVDAPKFEDKLFEGEPLTIEEFYKSRRVIHSDVKTKMVFKFFDAICRLAKKNKSKKIIKFTCKQLVDQSYRKDSYQKNDNARFRRIFNSACSYMPEFIRRESKKSMVCIVDFNYRDLYISYPRSVKLTPELLVEAFYSNRDVYRYEQYRLVYQNRMNIKKETNNIQPETPEEKILDVDGIVLLISSIMNQSDDNKRAELIMDAQTQKLNASKVMWNIAIRRIHDTTNDIVEFYNPK